MGVPPNHPNFHGIFPLQTNHFGVPPYMETPLYLSKDVAGSSPHMHLHSRGQGRQGWSGKTMHSRQT